jgi:Putative peptidoglycan binding domain
MKKFTAILISFSLALAAGAKAQQPEEQPSPGKKQHEKAHPGKEAQQGPKERAAHKEHAEHAEKAPARAEGAPKPEQSVQSAPAPDAVTKGAGKERGKANAKAQAEQRKTEQKPATSTETASPAPASTGVQSKAPAPSPAKANVQAKKPDPQVVQSVKAQHANFRAQPKPQQVPAVTFNQSYRIQGAEQWQGPQYEVFRTYRPEMHDQSWYRSHYSRVELIGGGYYYWNSGYWYPAWGYDPGAQYYVYDAPIYVGHSAEPPDRVIANVQAVLQQMGYYRGEVDGLLGPLTREALVGYQRDNGLYATAVIDEPTLDSLGMG